MIVMIAVSGAVPIALHIAFLLALCTVFFGAGSQTIFSSPPLQWLGQLSYSIYLVHWPVMAASKNVLGIEGTGDPLVKLTWIGVTIACAWGLTRWIEKPMIAVGKRVTALQARAVTT
jgi:peptidoglycan/LPS O-acetylase OafA/YrhL